MDRFLARRYHNTVWCTRTSRSSRSISFFASADSRAFRIIWRALPLSGDELSCRFGFTDQIRSKDRNNTETTQLRFARSLTNPWARDSRPSSAAKFVDDPMQFAATLCAASPFSAKKTRRCGQIPARTNRTQQPSATRQGKICADSRRRRRRRHSSMFSH